MIKYETCLRCNSDNVDLLKVNTRFSLNYPEKKNIYTGTITQTVLNPTDAMVCRDCGHIELFIDWEQTKQKR